MSPCRSSVAVSVVSTNAAPLPDPPDERDPFDPESERGEVRRRRL